MLTLTGAGGRRPRRTPSSPACSRHANARYGLAVGSGVRSSARVEWPRLAGMRIAAERLPGDHAM